MIIFRSLDYMVNDGINGINIIFQGLGIDSYKRNNKNLLYFIFNDVRPFTITIELSHCQTIESITPKITV